MDAAIYRRPNKTFFVNLDLKEEEAPERELPQLPEILEVDRATECHVTPDQVAARMVDYLGDVAGNILEPEAGTGTLIKALLNAGAKLSQITAIERHCKLFGLVAARYERSGLKAQQGCFLEYVKENEGVLAFDKILMNPPFSQTKKHIAAALSMLTDDGVLVALVPITFKHEEASFIEELPCDTFAAVTVTTKIIGFYK